MTLLCNVRFTAIIYSSEGKDEFESMDEAPTDDIDADQSMDGLRLTDQSTVDGLQDSHEPPTEAGLGGLDDDEEEFADELENQEDKKRAISPVTWDVDVHARDDNISVRAVISIVEKCLLA